MLAVTNPFVKREYDASMAGAIRMLFIESAPLQDSDFTANRITAKTFHSAFAVRSI